MEIWMNRVEWYCMDSMEVEDGEVRWGLSQGEASYKQEHAVPNLISKFSSQITLIVEWRYESPGCIVMICCMVSWRQSGLGQDRLVRSYGPLDLDVLNGVVTELGDNWSSG